MVSGISGMNNGIFIISMDFELAWGFHSNKKATGFYKENIIGARAAIPKLLDLFRKYNIHVTWAIVGALGCNSKNELLNLINKELVYTKNHHSILDYIQENVGENEDDDPLHFACSLIDVIKKYPNQYIASHSFSHFFLLEPTLNQDDFEKDITAFQLIFPETNTFVFARNQVTNEGITVLSKYGFKAYRGVQENAGPFNLYKEGKDKPFFIRALRFLDTYIPLSGYYDYSFDDLVSIQDFSPDKKHHCDQLLNIRASSILRPYKPELRLLERLKIYRIKWGMKRTAKKRGIYHLYWHPHNVGINQVENLQMIEEILAYYAELHRKYGMESMSMEEVCEAYEKHKSPTCNK